MSTYHIVGKLTGWLTFQYDLLWFNLYCSHADTCAMNPSAFLLDYDNGRKVGYAH